MPGCAVALHSIAHSQTKRDQTTNSRRFKLVNYRQDMRVALMRGGLQAPVRAAASEVLRLANPNEPLQVHLALTHDPT